MAQEREEAPMSPSEFRKEILAALEDYTYRLDTRYVARTEFQAVQAQATTTAATLQVLQVEFAALRRELERLTNTISRVGWAVGIGVFGAVGTALLSLVLR